MARKNKKHERGSPLDCLASLRRVRMRLRGIIEDCRGTSHDVGDQVALLGRVQAAIDDYEATGMFDPELIKSVVQQSDSIACAGLTGMPPLGLRCVGPKGCGYENLHAAFETKRGLLCPNCGKRDTFQILHAADIAN